MTDQKAVAGHRGMVGSSVVKKLKSLGYNNIITRTRSSLDLTDSARSLGFSKNSPDVVILCAAKVGGILANNTYRGDFIYDNLMISSNIIKSAHDSGVKKLINLDLLVFTQGIPKYPSKKNTYLW